jgi:hypothetical protein
MILTGITDFGELQKKEKYYAHDMLNGAWLYSKKNT